MAGLLWYRSYLQQYYADVDGYYPGIQAGQTDAVMELSMNRAFVSKDIPPSGFTEVEPEIVGGSVAWNQLVPDTGVGDVTPISGHIYYSVIGGVKDIKESDGTTISATAGTDNVTDLTLMLGSDVATYALGLETDQAGDGVAWLNKIGFFTEDDYPYNAGSLESVNTSAHVIKDADNNVVHTYSLDSTLTLRGLSKVSDDGVLYFDGDTYESDGTVTRKYAEVDLGSLTWTYNGTKFTTIGPISTIKPAPNNNTKGALICANFVTASASGSDSLDKSISVSASQRVSIHDSAYTDATAFKTAMSGVYLVCELIESAYTTEPASSFTSPQEIEPDGSESYTDYAYTQSTRDFEMPTGNISTYRIGD